MHPTSDTPPSSNRRSGIALIVVLGFLSVLIIMGVAFAIVMRTERMASRAFTDVARARQMTQVGLARALSDIDAQLNASGGIYPDFTTPGYPDTLVSAGTAYCSIYSTLGARGFLPLAVWSPLAAYPDPAFVEVRDPGQPGNPLIGRYGYLAINCSGLLDANYVGGLSRGVGTNAAELQLTTALLPELTAYGTTELPNRRTNELLSIRGVPWKRFESIPDLLAVTRRNETLPADIISTDSSIYWIRYTAAPYATLNNTSNLFTYSRAPSGWFDGTSVIQPVYVGGSPIVAGVVQTALALIPAAMPYASVVEQCLIDYVDSGFRPQSVNNFSTEATPLINEITIEQLMTAANSNVCRPSVELWYPFVGVTNNNTYVLALELTFSGAQPAIYNPKNTPTPGQYRAIYTFSGSRSSNHFITATILSTPALPFALGRDEAMNPPPSSLAGLQAEITRAELHEGSIVGPIVDSLPSGLIINLGFASTTPGAALTGGLAANDPRFNFRASEWTRVGQNSAMLATTGAFNSGVARPDLPGCDGWAATNMYVPNRALRSTGELGLLPSGLGPWQSIKLLGPNAWPVLSRFTVSTNLTYKGRVNVNSPHERVLATALLGAKAENRPDDPAATALTDAQAQTLATALFDGGPYVNVSDINAATGAGDAFAGFSALESEGIIRNTADLFTTRQQIFTIMVVGQHIDAQGSMAAERKLVAVVWRDPFPNAAGKHENFVRFFKWLDVLE